MTQRETNAIHRLWNEAHDSVLGPPQGSPSEERQVAVNLGAADLAEALVENGVLRSEDEADLTTAVELAVLSFLANKGEER